MFEKKRDLPNVGILKPQNSVFHWGIGIGMAGGGGGGGGGKIKNHKQAHQGPGHSSGIILNHPYPGYLPSVPSHSISNLKHHALSCLWTLDGAVRGPAMGVSSGSGLASSRLGSRRRLLALQRTLWRLDLPLLTCVLSQVVQGRSPPQAGNGRWMRRASFIEYHSRSGAWVAIGMLRSEGCWGFPFLKNKFKLV